MSPEQNPKGRRSKRIVAVPSGTVTFLFSDIEGSTHRWESHPEEMPHAIKRHDELMREAIERRGGYIFKTGGDAFCAAFRTASDALLAAIDAQRALANGDFSKVDGLRVRIGLHTGSAEERNADYFGTAVNRVARLMSIGHGGQVLLSEATYSLTHGDAPTEVTFTDLGQHRLKDLAQPEHIWQVSAHDLAAEFAPLTSLDRLPNNLPVQVTSFFGREDDLAEIKSHLGHHRMITLSGPGGIGKTRLAQQVGAEVLDRFRDGVWIVDFSATRDRELCWGIVAKTIGAATLQGRTPSDSVVSWLRDKQLLLVMDNCEHLLETAAAVADAIHRSCPAVNILITSRQALGVAGEKVLRLASLAVPAKSADLSVEAALQFGAVALFADRAALVDQYFRIDDDNAHNVANICRRLDGIPLAIELAAARASVLSVPKLARRLEERFDLLTSGNPAALPRQKTLGALIDWSYELLSPEERMLFDRTSIFAGAFSLDAVEVVCGGHGVDEKNVFETMASLTSKSLIVADPGGERDRYRLIEYTREYAAQKLKASKDFDRIARRHAEYFRDVALVAEERSETSPMSTWLATLDRDKENFRAAMEWALTQGHDPALGGRIAGALEMYWWHGRAEAEGRRWIDMALHTIDREKDADVASRLERALALMTSRMLFS